MNDENARPNGPAVDPALAAMEANRQLLRDARAKGKGATLGAFVKLSGPGWLQSAITLGGGSLAGSLYLGVIAGFSLLWLQPVAMLLGVLMLSTISYVTLSTGEKPFKAINQHVNPVLGWGWLIAALLANCVWSLPQFGLGFGAVSQNLLPNLFGPGAMDPFTAKLIVSGVILAVCLVMVFFYDAGGRGVKIFDIVLKLMVGVIVLSFFGVVVFMSAKGHLPWGKVGGGLIPDIRLFWTPAATFSPFLDTLSESARTFWTKKIVSQQQDVMIAAAAVAVGINMTFLLPYSMLKRGWNKDFRGLATFDLSTGLLIPFVLATSCVVIASASQFHVTPGPGLIGEVDAATGKMVSTEKPDPKLLKGYNGLASQRLVNERGSDVVAKMTPEQKTAAIAALPLGDRQLAAMLVKRDSNHLAAALSPMTGNVVANYVFGIGVLGMAVSTIIILMLINGFCVCEMFDKPSTGWLYRLGCAIPAVGVLGPFIWSGAAPYLAIPTSVFGFILIPIAYTTFAMLLNQKKLLGDAMPTGLKRTVWNALLLLTVGVVTIGAIYMVWKKSHWYGLAGVGAFTALAIVVHVLRKKKGKEALL